MNNQAVNLDDTPALPLPGPRHLSTGPAINMAGENRAKNSGERRGEEEGEESKSIRQRGGSIVTREGGGGGGGGGSPEAVSQRQFHRSCLHQSIKCPTNAKEMLSSPLPFPAPLPPPIFKMDIEITVKYSSGMANNSERFKEPQIPAESIHPSNPALHNFTARPSSAGKIPNKRHNNKKIIIKSHHSICSNIATSFNMAEIRNRHAVPILQESIH